MMQHCEWCEPDEDDDEPVLAATEPSVQVPVSLVEVIRKEAHPYTCDSHNMYGIPAHWGACDCWHAELDALLSQPTATAEPVQHPCERDGHDDYCGACATCGRAAPPSIADMVPGTTFTEASNGWPRTAWTVGQRHDGTRYAKRQSDGWVLDPKDIDPSTIRDVTPPTLEGPTR